MPFGACEKTIKYPLQLKEPQLEEAQLIGLHLVVSE